MIKCVQADAVSVKSGVPTVRALLQADAVSGTIPHTGEGINGIPDSNVLAFGSVCYVENTDKVYILSVDGETWVEHQ